MTCTWKPLCSRLLAIALVCLLSHGCGETTLESGGGDGSQSADDSRAEESDAAVEDIEATFDSRDDSTVDIQGEVADSTLIDTTEEVVDSDDDVGEPDVVGNDSVDSVDTDPASCFVEEVGGGRFTFSPDPPRAQEGIVVGVSDHRALTNVDLELCTFTGSVRGSYQRLDGEYTWFFTVPPLPEGEVQAIFRADPEGAVYSTARRVVEPAREQPDLCSMEPGNLIPGGFEEGMVGLAPRGWQVRDPGAPGRCGSPEQHVYLTSPPPGCAGQALAIDARGQWDCYAVQTFTDYDTIIGGQTYRVTATVRSEGQNNPASWFIIGVQWLDGSDRVFGDEKNPRPSEVNFDWTSSSWELVAPQEARRAVVWLTAHYPGLVVYDNVSLTPAF